MTDRPVKALSIRQPWAWAIINAGKDIENRSAAAVRHGMTPGRIAVHAAKGMTQDEYIGTREFMERTVGVACPRPDALVRGAVIGFVTVTAIVQEHRSAWFFGPRGLVLADSVACEPIPALGALGYFNWAPRGEVEAPLPWMTAWPDSPRKQGRPAEPPNLPLFSPSTTAT